MANNYGKGSGMGGGYHSSNSWGPQPGNQHKSTYVVEQQTTVNHWSYIIAYALIAFSLGVVWISGGGFIAVAVKSAGLIYMEAMLIKTHGSLAMLKMQGPAGGMLLFLVGAALGVLNGNLWALLYIAPIVTIVLMITNVEYRSQRKFGLITGVLIIVLNIVVGVASFYTKTAFLGGWLFKTILGVDISGLSAVVLIPYMVLQLFNPVGLMGIATLLMFVKNLGIYDQQVKTVSTSPWNNGGSAGSSGGRSYGR